MITRYPAGPAGAAAPSARDWAGYRLLGARVGSLHRLRGFTRARSSFAVCSPMRAVRATRSGRRYGTLQCGCALSSPLCARGCLTIGRLPRTAISVPANIIVGSEGLTLIDWDRFSSVSPALDVCLPLVDACGHGDGMAAEAAFAAAYTEAGGELDLALLRRSIDLIGDLYIVHGWLRASSVPELPGRRRHFRDWVLPRWRRWDQDRSTCFDIWKEHLR